MALVLRKVILPKNVSLLKCIKGQGRSIASSANKKPAAILSNFNTERSLKEQSSERGDVPKDDNQESMQEEAEVYPQMTHTWPTSSFHSHLDIPYQYTPGAMFGQEQQNLNFCYPHTYQDSNPSQLYSTALPASVRGICSACTCPCPGPSNCQLNGACLPPPCNTPPKCLQYMTGYYYYPYGNWFCGPYHVPGLCVPSGPCSPGPCPGPCPCPSCIVPHIGSSLACFSPYDNYGSYNTGYPTYGQCTPNPLASRFCNTTANFNCGYCYNYPSPPSIPVPSPPTPEEFSKCPPQSHQCSGSIDESELQLAKLKNPNSVCFCESCRSSRTPSKKVFEIDSFLDKSMPRALPPAVELV